MIDGWAEDDHDAAFATFRNSCKAILRGLGRRAQAGRCTARCTRSARRRSRPSRRSPARRARSSSRTSARCASRRSATPDGFLTGYYEPIVEGVREQTDGYDHPLYRKPPSLLGRPHGGRRAALSKEKEARKRRLVPFHDRAAIDDGAVVKRKPALDALLFLTARDRNAETAHLR